MLKKKGDIARDLNNVQRTLEEDANNLSLELAEGFYNLLISNIQSNKFGFSLSEATLMRRAFLGLGDKPLIARGEYINGITIEGFKVTVIDAIHSGSGLSFSELSDILEYGRRDKRIHAFPVWRLTYEEYKPIADKKVQEFFDRIL